MSIHESCLKEYNCDVCSIEYCNYCVIDCELCEEIYCPNCYELYRIKLDDNNYKDICNICKETLEYNDKLDDCEIVKINNSFEFNEVINSNMKLDLVDLIIEDIYNIKKYEEKNSFYFDKKYITYEMILFELMETDLSKVVFYINYIKDKIDIRKVLLNETINKYEDKVYIMSNITKIDILDYMIELGGDANIGEKTCLIRNLEKYQYDGVYTGNFGIIKYLIENIKVDVNKGNPLKVITRLSKLEKNSGKQEIIKLLLKNGSIPDENVRKKINFIIKKID